MPSCVLIGLKDGKTKYPVLSEKYIDELSDRNAKFPEAKETLSTKTYKWDAPHLKR